MRALLALALLLALAPAAHAGPTIGIADQKADMFDDPRFLEAGVRVARVQVGWDVMSTPWEAQELDLWLRKAREAGVRPLVSFGHSRTSRRTLPTPERLRHELRRVRARWPWVREFAAWNEANHCGEPTCNRPRLVAAYWRALRKECAGRCTVLAAELLDMPNMRRWTQEFLRHADKEPAVWGLHNYVDANRFRTRSLRTLLRTVRGRVWLTETGGLVARYHKRRETVDLQESKWHAKRVTRFLLRDVARVSPRLQRIYLYHWGLSDEARLTWDSALFDRAGRPRPAWALVRDALRTR